MPRCLSIILLLAMLPTSVWAQTLAAEPDLSRLPAPAAISVSEHELTGDPLRLSATVSGQPRAFAVLGRLGKRVVPYMAPYDMRVSASGSYWVALYSHTAKSWRLASGELQGDALVSIGLDPNAVDERGVFRFALLPGRDATISGFSLRYPKPPAQGQPVDYQLNVHARDGTMLATNVYMPFEQRGPLLPKPPFPVLLIRTPYEKRHIGAEYISWVSKFNAVVVIQYFRGRPTTSGVWPSSGGIPSLFRDHAGPEHFDAVDTVRWIRARGFQDGRLLMVGASALGLWIYQAATELPQQVTATYAIAAAGDVGRWAAGKNGVLKQANVDGWLSTFEFPDELAWQVRLDAQSAALWSDADFNSRASRVTSPGWHETGWWDVDVEETIASWKALQERGGSGARGQQWLVIGPWVHEGIRMGRAGELTFPFLALEQSPTLLPLGWEGGLWSAWQLGHNPFYAPPQQRVRAYFVGAQGAGSAPSNTWYALPSWPPPFRDGVFHLTPDGKLAAVVGAAGRLRFDLDPSNPVPTIGGSNLPLNGVKSGPMDQAHLYARDDVLRFRTDPLSGRRCIAGPIRVRLFVETDARDTDVMVKLIDQYPDGRQMLIADAPVRLSWHAEQNGAREVPNGRAYELSFEVGQRAYVFGPGHRIGIDVQGTNYPRFDVNPGTGTGNRGIPAPVVQRNTLHVGGRTPSTLTLPLFDPSL